MTSSERAHTRIQPLDRKLEQTGVMCANALNDAQLGRIDRWLSQREGRIAACVRASAMAGKATPELTELREQATSDLQLEPATAAFERTVLLRTALRSLGSVPQLPVDESVMRLFCRDFAFYASPEPSELSSFSLASPDYCPRLRVAMLERFPTGQTDCHVSGIPRSWLLKASGLDLPRFLRFIAKAGGVEPFFVGHLSCGRRSAFLLERDLRLGFYRSALAIEKQPSIRGHMAASWLHSRETHRVSPHLAFLNRPFTEAGGLYIDLGPAEIADGFAEGDPHRSELYARGEYKPTFALVACTREQMLAWKEKNRDLEARLVR